MSKMSSESVVISSLPFIERSPVISPPPPAHPPTPTSRPTMTTFAVSTTAASASFASASTLSGSPSLCLSYHPSTIQHQQPFSLTPKSSLGLWGSPRQILFSVHLPLLDASPPLPTTPPISFSVQISANFGDFSFKKSVPTSSFQTPATATLYPNPYSKENGGSIYRPLPIVREEEVTKEEQQHQVHCNGARDWLLSSSGVMVRTMFLVSRRAELKLRWGVNFLASTTVVAMTEGIGGNMSLPFMVVDMINIESIVKEVEEEERMTATADDGIDMGGLKGMCFWMRKEAEDMQRDQLSIRESIGELRWKLLPFTCSTNK